MFGVGEDEHGLYTNILRIIVFVKDGIVLLRICLLFGLGIFLGKYF
jgi:hypothetical protein